VPRIAHLLTSHYVDRLMADVNAYLADGWRLVSVVYTDDRRDAHYATAQSANVRGSWYAFLERTERAVDLTDAAGDQDRDAVIP
jgi:hypothetical protein